MMFIDTDGFVCNITNVEDAYRDMFENNMFDMSCCDEKFTYYRKSEYEMGKMIDELPYSVITEAVSLKDKLYAVKRKNDQIKCKGIKDNINFSNLKNAVFNNELINTKFNTMNSTNNCRIYSYTDAKTLMGYTDKRYLLNQTESYPYGHFMINNRFEDLI